jgi:hypothetical protein
MKTIKDVKLGTKIENKRNGKGMVTHKTPRTITVMFFNGNKVKNTYKHSDAYFYESDF